MPSGEMGFDYLGSPIKSRRRVMMKEVPASVIFGFSLVLVFLAWLCALRELSRCRSACSWARRGRYAGLWNVCGCAAVLNALISGLNGLQIENDCLFANRFGAA